MLSRLQRWFQRLCYLLIVRNFVAGETITEALPRIHALRAKGFSLTIDLLGEAVTTLDEAATHTEEYVRLIHTLSREQIPVNVSVKLSAIGLCLDADAAERNLRAILAAANQFGGSDSFVRVDMEDSTLTSETLRIVRNVHAESPWRVGTVLQASLFRTKDDLDTAVAAGICIRLCKGAYREPPDRAAQGPQQIRRRYSSHARYLLRYGNRPAFATHDDILIEHIRAFAERNGITPDRFEFQMLYGIRSELARSLVAAGYRVRIYVPVGDAWWKYFRRRLDEGKPWQLIGMFARNALRRNPYQ